MKEDKKFSIVKPHFRFHYRKHKTKSDNKNHYSLIVGSNDKEYAYNSLTHSSKSGHKKNKELSLNPNKKDKCKAYLRRELNSDKKRNFSEEITKMNLDPKDEKEIMDIIKRNKHFN